MIDYILLLLLLLLMLCIPSEVYRLVVIVSLIGGLYLTLVPFALVFDAARYIWRKVTPQ